MQLWRHPNGVWYVRYGARGRKRVSAQTTDRRDAEKFLARFITLEGIPRTKITVGELIAAYRVDAKTRVRSPDAIAHAERALASLSPLYPNQLTPPAIRAWAASLRVSNGTILRHVGVLRAALHWGVKSQWIAQAPHVSNPVPTPPPRDRWLTKDEARALLAACQEPHVRLFVILGLMTVARMSAILEAKWDQVDFDRRVIDYGPGHGNKRRAIVPLNDEALRALKAAYELRASDYVVEFRGAKVGTVKNGFAAACRRASLKDVTPHILRHTGATWMALDGIPLAEIARMLGDAQATVEKVYAKHHPDYLRSAARALQLSP